MKINITAKGIVWNIVGNIIASAITFIFSIVIARVNGTYEVGLYSIAWALVSLVSTIGLYNMRNYQITDVKETYSFNDYKVSRRVTIGLMITVSTIICILGNYSNEVKAIVFLLTLNEAINAYSDVYQGMFQMEGYLDTAGKTKVIRYSAYLISFIGILLLTQKLVPAFLVMVVVNLMLFLSYDMQIVKKYNIVSRNADFGQIRELLYKCFPLFLSSFFVMYYLNAPKYAINTFMDEYNQGIYNILYMLTFVLNLFAIICMQPIMPYLAVESEKEDKRNYIRLIHLIILGVIILITISQLVVVSIGIPILSVLYRVDLREYEGIFRVLLVVGGIQAITGILQNALIIMRKQTTILCGAGITCIVLYFASNILVKEYGILGATLANLLGATILFIIFYGLFWIYILKNRIH